VFSGTLSSGNEKLPAASVTCTLDAFWKPCVYGNGLLWSTTWRFALPVPVSWPASVTGLPNATGLGVAASDTPSGWGLVLNVRSAPLTRPLRLRATSR
jgi:hypothetical protein